jgi:hypothetical protein
VSSLLGVAMAFWMVDTSGASRNGGHIESHPHFQLYFFSLFGEAPAGRRMRALVTGEERRTTLDT